jgi:hypothetical protein
MAKIHGASKSGDPLSQNAHQPLTAKASGQSRAFMVGWPVSLGL